MLDAIEALLLTISGVRVTGIKVSALVFSFLGITVASLFAVSALCLKGNLM